MKTSQMTKVYLRRYDLVHQAVVEKIMGNLTPGRPVWPILKQWLAWLLASASVMIFLVVSLNPQHGFNRLLNNTTQGVYFAVSLLASAFCAWGAIASSIPAEEPGFRHKILVPTVLVFLSTAPFLFFPITPGEAGIWELLKSGWVCARSVLVLSLIPYGVLGFLVSRNASFHAGWTGAWAGVSAYLLSSITVQLHCQIWETGHMVAAHLLPGLVVIPLSVWIGFWWFSRWDKSSFKGT